MFRCLLLCVTLSIAAIANFPTPQVTIIGAGLAGLTTAYRLQQMGIPSEIYEARNRPGGRICTAYFGTSYEELGGKNLNDGGEAKSATALIAELGLSIRSRAIASHRVVIYQGKHYPFHTLFHNAPLPDPSTFCSLEQRLPFSCHLGELIDPLFETTPILRHVMWMMMAGWEGSSPDALSPQYLYSSFWDIYSKSYRTSQLLSQGNLPETIQRTVEGGNSLLIEALVHALENPIHFNSPLKAITKENDRFVLYCDGHDPIVTDYLILALPCSTLRDVSIQEGLFPEDQLHAIQTLQYGTNAKILLPVKLLDDPIPENMFTEHAISWFNQDYSVMTLYYGGESGVFASLDPASLAAIMAREMPDISIAYPHIDFPAGCTPVVRKESFKAHYTTPVGISWSKEKFSKGSYCNYGIGQFAIFNATTEDLAEIVRTVFRSINNRVFFAGEHTAVQEPATIEGAISSGEQTARMVYRAIKTHLTHLTQDELK